MQKKYSKFFRAMVIALTATIVLALIGVAKLFGYDSPKAATVLTNFVVILGSSWVASVVVASMNKGDFLAKKESNKSQNVSL